MISQIIGQYKICNPACTLQMASTESLFYSIYSYTFEKHAVQIAWVDLDIRYT